MPYFLGDKFLGQNRGKPVYQREYGDLEVYSFRWGLINAGWSSNKATYAFSATAIAENGLGNTKPVIPDGIDLYIWGWDVSLWSRYGGTNVGDNKINKLTLFDGAPLNDVRPDASGVPLLTLDNVFYKTPSAANGNYVHERSQHDFPSPIKIRRKTDGESTIWFQFEREGSTSAVGGNIEIYVMAFPNGEHV